MGGQVICAGWIIAGPGIAAIKVSSKGQIAIPKAMRDELNLLEGTHLTLEVRGHELVLSQYPSWKKLRGAAQNLKLPELFAVFRKVERQLEDSGS